MARIRQRKQIVLGTANIFLKKRTLRAVSLQYSEFGGQVVRFVIHGLLRLQLHASVA